MTNSENLNQKEVSNTVEKLSPSSSSKMSLPLKALEYLFLSSIVCVGIIIYFLPSKQDLVIWEAVFVSIWLFLFLPPLLKNCLSLVTEERGAVILKIM